VYNTLLAATNILFAMNIHPLLSPLVILLAVLLYGAVHSLLASLGAKSLVQRRFGAIGSGSYRLGYNAFAFISFFPVMVLAAVLPDRAIYSIPTPWVFLSITIQGLAAVFLLIALLQTGLWSFLGFRQLVPINQEKHQKLVVRGAYRYVRHPLYAAGLVLIWLIPRMTLNMMALNLSLSLYLVIGALIEERKLLQEFGEDYAAYQDRTPMLFPKLRKQPESIRFP